MKLDPVLVDRFFEQGYLVLPNFLSPETLAAAQEGLWSVFPRPEQYFAAPEQYPVFSRSQFAGLRLFPYPSWSLNRLAVLPGLVDVASQLCGTTDLHLYKVELWAKFSGAIDYDQTLHRDYGNHSLVVPRKASKHVQLTTFILLSDVTERDAPTRLVPIPAALDVPFVPRELPRGALEDHEIAITGKAGTLFIYRTDVLHRGTNFTDPGRSRFTMLVDFQPRGWAWTGKMAWPNQSLSPHWTEAMVRMTPDQRGLFGFPMPGDPYWDEQTIKDVGLRYPGMDMFPYQS